MPQAEGGGGSPIKGTTDGAGSNANDVKALAQALGITPEQAAAAIRKYGSAADAYTALYNAPRTPTSGGGGSGSSGGSSGGGSSGGGSAGPDPQDIANAVESYVSTFNGWGVPVTPAIRSWLKQRIVAGASSAAIINAFRKTKAYAHAFPGLVRRDGTLRMSEAQYIAGYQSVKDYASSVGRGMTKKAYGAALKMGNSPAEMKAKVEAIDILKTNRALFTEFSDYLMATGVNKKPLTRKDLQKLVMRQGPKEWEDAWETANQSAALEKFGVSVGRGDDVSYKELTKLRAQMLPGQDVDYTALAGMAEKLGASRLYGLGISKKDLVDMAYGTKRAPKIAERVKLALGTAEAAATEQRANPQLTPQGLGNAPRPQQATE